MGGLHGAPGGFWLVVSGWVVELLGVGTVWRIVLARLRCSSSACISMNSEFPFDWDEKRHRITPRFTARLLPSHIPRCIVPLPEFLNAGQVPKNARRNPS